MRQPGSTALGDRIRAILLDSRSEATLGSIAPLAELALMFADRAQQIEELISPALARGEVVLCDRYTDSSEAYQGAGRELGSGRVLALHRALCNDVQPDLTLLLLPRLETCLFRARRRNARHVQQMGADENRFEREGDAFYGRIHAAFERIAVRDTDRVVKLADDAAIPVIEAQIAAVVRERMAAVNFHAVQLEPAAG